MADSNVDPVYPYAHHSELQVISKGFRVPNRQNCTVTFTIEPDKEPKRNGIDLLNLTAPENTVGFPLAYGKVSSPNSRGYASFYGWVQITAQTHQQLPADLSNATWEMDPIPMTDGLNNPFVWFGSEPTLFDGPFNVGPKELDWVCRSFLAYVPDVGLTTVVVPILGFEWGYWIKDGKSNVKELRSLDVGTWNEHLDLFRDKFQGWEFRES